MKPLYDFQILEKIIEDSFTKIKQKFYEELNIEEYEEDTNLFILSLRNVVKSLPTPSIKVIEVINELVEARYDKGFLIKYDHTIKEEIRIEFCGSISSKDKEMERNIGEKFKMSKKQLEFTRLY